MKKILFIIYAALLFLNANLNAKDDFIIKSQENEMVTIVKNSFRIIEFKKMIVDILASDSEKMNIYFVENRNRPLQTIKFFAKKAGIVNILITFDDQTTKQLKFKIVNDISDTIALVNNISKNVEVVQINDKIVLKGIVKNNKIKTKILSLLEKKVEEKSNIIDLLNIEEPDKMVRLKLYVAEINNNKGETIKNNWSFDSGFDNNTGTLDVTSNMLNAVTLSGGLTAVANKLGSRFNTGLTLNYLKSNGVAQVLDETTLITLESQESNFLAGGTLLVKTSTTSSEGQPVSEITEINYGLELNITVQDIVNGKYVSLKIDTSSSTLDQENGVDGIPAKKDKSIKTNVVVENNATIVLGGLINNTNSRDFEKIPLLGDIPIIGALFRSKAFRDGNSELIFFITPTIVDAATNEQKEAYNNISNKIIPSEPKQKLKETVINDKKEISNKSQHDQILQDVFGIN